MRGENRHCVGVWEGKERRKGKLQPECKKIMLFIYLLFILMVMVIQALRGRDRQISVSLMPAWSTKSVLAWSRL